MTTNQLSSDITIRLPPPVHRFSVAPMLGWTDRHCLYFLRLLSKQSLLYTEMITTGAILNGKRLSSQDHRQFTCNGIEGPLALQLGGNDPKDLARCAQLAEQLGYAEINLNCGCPSNKVQQGCFGAHLMKFPELVAACVSAMRDKVSIPVTVKHRIGVDRHTSYEQLANFVGTVAASGCQSFIVHARAAWLDGISPKQNRTLPPLDYNMVYKLKEDFPDCVFTINGGVRTVPQARQLLDSLDGVMVGREAYKNPYILAQVDQLIYGNSKPQVDRLSVLEDLIYYAENELVNGVRLRQITRHILGLFRGQPGARRFRQLLSTQAKASEVGTAVLKEALALMSVAQFSTRPANTNSASLVLCS